MRRHTITEKGSSLIEALVSLAIWGVIASSVASEVQTVTNYLRHAEVRLRHSDAILHALLVSHTLPLTSLDSLTAAINSHSLLSCSEANICNLKELHTKNELASWSIK